MSKIDVDGILSSVLNDTNTNPKELAKKMHTLVSNILMNFPENRFKDTSYVYSYLFVTLTEAMIEREMEIYKNVSTMLQRVVDQIQTNHEST